MTKKQKQKISDKIVQAIFLFFILVAIGVGWYESPYWIVSIFILIFASWYIYHRITRYKKIKQEAFETSVKHLFDFREYELMDAFHATYFKDEFGKYPRKTKANWFEKIETILDQSDFPPDIDETDDTKKAVIKQLHQFALDHNKAGALKFSFKDVNSLDMLIETAFSELDLNGWSQISPVSDDKNIVDLKVKKNQKTLNLICIYDVGKIGIGKIRDRLLDVRQEPANQTALLSLHGFTGQAKTLCKDCDVFAITPEDIPFLDDRMGI